MPVLQKLEDKQAILKAIRDSAMAEHRSYKIRADLALDYLAGRQLDDTMAMLSERYPKTQGGGAGQQIEPVTIPLTERYVAEAASLYNRPVTRKVVNIETGEEDPELTATLKKNLDAARYDFRMHRLEQLLVLLGDAGLWFQAKAGELRLVVTPPQNIYPVAIPGGEFIDPADQRDYEGFIVELTESADPTASKGRRFFALSTASQTIFYTGEGPYEPDGELSVHDNPFVWPQRMDTEDRRGAEADLPLQMFTVWNENSPLDSVLSYRDSDIVFLNREVNIQWSMLLDTMRLQGWDTTVINVMDPTSSHTNIDHGSRFPVKLKVGETVSKLGSATPYAAITETIKGLIKTAAIAHRQSPNDFAIEGAAPTSGFAKLVDSLPKLEAREERVALMKDAEERVAWPRIGAIGAYLGWDGFTPETVKKHRMVASFSDVTFPRTVQEQTQLHEHALKLNLTTPAQIMAEKKGISVEEAQSLIDENAEANKKPAPQEPEAPQQTSLLGSLIGNRNSQ